MPNGLTGKSMLAVMVVAAALHAVPSRAQSMTPSMDAEPGDVPNRYVDTGGKGTRQANQWAARHPNYVFEWHRPLPKWYDLKHRDRAGYYGSY